MKLFRQPYTYNGKKYYRFYNQDGIFLRTERAELVKDKE